MVMIFDVPVGVRAVAVCNDADFMETGGRGQKPYLHSLPMRSFCAVTLAAK